jgi:hypothetical protein
MVLAYDMDRRLVFSNPVVEWLTVTPLPTEESELHLLGPYLDASGSRPFSIPA